MTSPRLNILDDFDFADLDEPGALDGFGSLDDFGAKELDELSEAIAAQSQSEQSPCQVFTSWVDGPRSISHMKLSESTEQTCSQDFFLVIDEPEEVGGNNLGPNPQEVVLAALNAFLVRTFTQGCTSQGIHLEKVEVASSGQLDLRSFFGLSGNMSPVHKFLNWTLTVKGDATLEEFQQIFEVTLGFPPTAWNLVVIF